MVEISPHRMAVLIEMIEAAKKKKKKKKKPVPDPVYGQETISKEGSRFMTRDRLLKFSSKQESVAEHGANFKQGNPFKGPNKPRTKDTKKCPPGKVYRNGKCTKE